MCVRGGRVAAAAVVALAATMMLTARPARAQRTPGAARQVFNPPGVSALVPQYSLAVRHGNLVFVAGMTGVDPKTQQLVPGGIGPETRQTLENVKTILQSAGATMADVVECTVFLVDMRDYAGMNEAYGQYFAKEPPARATVGVASLPRLGARVEIKCSAAVAGGM
jgi:2-iminobutanoate/2-iminopropanoate deaminase